MFEGLGTSELLLILVVALIIFGPRKLPQLSRSLGKSLADFKRASDDFKQTWEKEVARESAIKDALIGEAMLPEDRSILGESRDRSQAVIEAGEAAEPTAADSSDAPLNNEAASSISAADSTAELPESTPPARKRDWL
ncbi:MAG TPA: twin-arginine translocase TatA/TatE family subunit [Pyrinomonadaceae bacterium]